MTNALEIAIRTENKMEIELQISSPLFADLDFVDGYSEEAESKLDAITSHDFDVEYPREIVAQRSSVSVLSWLTSIVS